MGKLTLGLSSFRPTEGQTRNNASSGTGNSRSESRPPDRPPVPPASDARSSMRSRSAAAFRTLREALHDLRNKKDPSSESESVRPADTTTASSARAEAEGAGERGSDIDDSPRDDEETPTQQIRQTYIAPDELPAELFEMILDYIPPQDRPVARTGLSPVIEKREALGLLTQLNGLESIKEPEPRVELFKQVATDAQRCLVNDNYRYELGKALGSRIPLLPFYQDNQIKAFEQAAELFDQIGDDTMKANGFAFLAPIIDKVKVGGTYSFPLPKRGKLMELLAEIVSPLLPSAAKEEAVLALASGFPKRFNGIDLEVAFPPVADLVEEMEDSVEKGQAIAALADQLHFLRTTRSGTEPYSRQNATERLQTLTLKLQNSDGRNVAQAAMAKATTRPTWE